MARQRLVKAYGKKGVRKIDVSDEWKKCLRESPVVSLRSRGPASSLLTSQKAKNYPLKEIYPSVDQSSILTSSRSFESSSATFPSPCSSHVDTPQENKTSKNVSYFGRSSSQRKDTPSVSFVADSENPLPPNTSTPFPRDPRLIVNNGLEGREHRPGSSAEVSGYKCIVESSRESTPQTRNRSNIVGSNVGSSNRLGTPTTPLSEGRSYEELVSSASSREVSVVLEKMSLLALSATGHQIAPRPQNRSDMNHSNKENVLRENVQMSCLDSPCVTGLLTPEDKEFLHEDSIEFAYHKLRLTPPGKSSTPKEKKQGHNTSDYVSPLLAYLSPARKKVVTDEKKVLSICEQKEPISIDSILPSKQCDILKLGEGVYGEVFSFSRDTVGTVAIKVVPVEGAVVVNGENQKTLKEMLPEMVITKELSLLKGCSENRTSNFIQLHRMTYGIGAYPKPLLDTWNTWNVQHDSENDCPDVFCSDQRYIVFETEHGGVDLEHYKISKTSEAVGLFWQVCGTLAVAEKELEFEHRDLHWGNVLVSPTSEQTMTFTIDGRQHQVATNGLRAVIIDYTLSRLKKEECVSYNDLSSIDWLFEGEGDYQFEVYRLMRSETKSDWRSFHPKTNVYWLHYLADKLHSKLKRPGKEIKTLKDSILNYSSSLELFLSRTL